MCGFLCVFAPGTPVEKKQLENGLHALSHRGPDEFGHWHTNDGRIHLGHARLSIIDLKQGKQPLISQDGHLVVVVNGEFYDYQRITHDLIGKGYHFKTHSDSEILLYLYQEYGEQCFEYLRGEFAFVLWDDHRKQIFAGRDRFGIKPLFYYQDNTNIYFASEIKAFKAMGLKLQWNHDTFYQENSMLHIPDNTMVKNIKELPAAHYLTKSFESEALNLAQYWDIDYLHEEQQKKITINEQEAIEGFRERLDEAVKLRLQADVPVACYLSGGIDSSAILGIAQKFSKAPITAFTLSFDEQAYDEAPFAKETAQFTQSKYIEIPITARELVDNFEDAVFKGEKLAVNGHFVAKYLLSKKVRQNDLKVVLTGEGSDEFLGGYASFKQDYLTYYLNEMPEEQKQELEAKLKKNDEVNETFWVGKNQDNTLESAKKLLGYKPNWISVFSNMTGFNKQLYRRGYLDFMKNQDPVANLLNSFSIKQKLNGRGILHQSMYLWARSGFPHYMLTMLSDRMEMAHSVEGRLPFLDHKLTEFIAHLPENFKIRDLKEKYILREATKDVLTKTIYKRMKHPFISPPSKLEQNKLLHEFILDKIHSDSMKKQPFYDPKKLIDFATRSNQEIDPVQSDTIILQAVSASILGDKLGLS